MSGHVEKRLIALLDHPRHDPYGNPIPGLEELGERGAGAFLAGVTPIASAATAGQESVVIARIAEPLQVDIELLERFQEAGLIPGARVAVTRDGGGLILRAEGSDVELEVPGDFTRHVFVEA